MESSYFGEKSDFFTPTDVIPLDTYGGTSDTYKVSIGGKWHFMKRPKRQFITHPQYNAAFEKEFDIGYTLDHPHIVRYIAKGRDGAGFYFLTEYVDGQTLKDFIVDNPDYFKKKEHVQKFIEQLLSALSYLHTKQILHLDLKPANILITNIGQDVKVIDLGFAYTDCYQFLTTGKTNRYAAPEQIIDGKIDQRTDIYGIGKLLLYVFTEETGKKALNMVPLFYRRPVKKCLEYDKERRYANVQSLRKSISNISNHKIILYSIAGVLFIGIVFWFSYFLAPEKPETRNEGTTPALQDSPVFRDTINRDTIKPNNPVSKDTLTSKRKVKNKVKAEQASKLTQTHRLYIQTTIKGYFAELYANYKSIDNNNYFAMQHLYEQAVGDSFALINSLCLGNPDLAGEIDKVGRAELDKNASIYLSWLMKYSKQQQAKLEQSDNE